MEGETSLNYPEQGSAHYHAQIHSIGGVSDSMICVSSSSKWKNYVFIGEKHSLSANLVTDTLHLLLRKEADHAAVNLPISSRDDIVFPCNASQEDLPDRIFDGEEIQLQKFKPDTR